MALEEYRQKRDFARTPEPEGGPSGTHDALRFVVHKHAASRLHYDLRLEMDGVLRSWAVPKGPSLDPAQKHLAVAVEDHPLEYGSFEGTIPKGEYGAGTVMVWDAGTYTPLGDARAGYEKGDFKFELHGTKLKGTWVLVRMKRRPKETKDNWLLIKERDPQVRPAAEYDILKALPDSAQTGRTMEEIAAAGDADPGGDDPDPSTVEGARRAALPAAIEPELATLVETPPVGEAWLHEIKLDGYRVLCRIDGDEVRFFTRTGLDWTDRFVALVTPVRALGIGKAWLDGEVVVLLPDGRTSFGALQAELSRGASADLRYCAFDLLYLDGYDLRDAPLRSRKQLLQHALAGADARVRYVDHVAGSGPDFYRQACELALEGSMAKRADSAYRSGRGRDWQKVKCLGREDFAVIGYTLPSNGGSGIGALVLASAAPSGALAYAGRVGTGWSVAESQKLRKRLEAIETVEPAAAVPARESRGVRWTNPELAVEVAFAERTSAGLVRHAAYQGVREDVSEDPPARRAAASSLTHPDKVLFSVLGATKRDLASYYERVERWVLPQLAGRPLVLVRCPEGADRGCFYQKNAETGFPASVGHVVVQHEEGAVAYAVVDSLEGLIALVQLGVLEIHTWGSLADDVEHPDRLIFDLDPGPGVSWAALRTAAHAVRDTLEELGATAFLKTTGGKGLHVVVPARRSLDWQGARDVAKAVAERIASRDPSAYTTNPLKKYRQGRIFIDYVRNTRGATAVAAYSTRARPEATVSVPLRWDELAVARELPVYDLRTVPRRLAALGADPWAAYGEEPADLAALGRTLGVL